MGCGSSRLNSVEEVIPEKIRPLLFRRYEELKKRRQRSAAAMQRETTLSKKKLLKEDEDINSNNSSDAAEAEHIPAVTSPRKVEPTNKVAPLPLKTDTENQNDNTNQQTLQEKEKEKDATGDDKDTKETQEKVSAKNEDEQVEEKSDEDEDEDDDDFEFGDVLVCPASPSFRIYCLPPQDDKDETKGQQEMVTSQKSSSVESAQSPASGHVKTPSVDSPHSVVSSQNSKNLNECAETQSASKTRRNRKKKFRAVKNIMVVKSLYTSCSCAGADRTRLAAAKTMK